MSSSRATALATLRDEPTEDGRGSRSTKSAGIVEALNLADQIAKTEALYAEADRPTDMPEPTPEVEEALAEPIGKPVFNSHSQAFIGRLMAEERSLKETAGNLRARINELEAEYTDVMLAESGVSAAIQAIKNNGQQ